MFRDSAWLPGPTPNDPTGTGALQTSHSHDPWSRRYLIFAGGLSS